MDMCMAGKWTPHLLTAWVYHKVFSKADVCINVLHWQGSIFIMHFAVSSSLVDLNGRVKVYQQSDLFRQENNNSACSILLKDQHVMQWCYVKLLKRLKEMMIVIMMVMERKRMNILQQRFVAKFPRKWAAEILKIHLITWDCFTRCCQPDFPMENVDVQTSTVYYNMNTAKATDWMVTFDTQYSCSHTPG